MTSEEKIVLLEAKVDSLEDRLSELLLLVNDIQTAAAEHQQNNASVIEMVTSLAKSVAVNLSTINSNMRRLAKVEQLGPPVTKWTN